MSKARIPPEGAAGGAELPSSATAFQFRWGSDEFVVLSFPTPEVMTAQALPRLTAAEQSIVALLLRGQSTAAIAAARGRSRRTVESQVAAIYRKLEVGSRRELRAYFREGIG